MPTHTFVVSPKPIGLNPEGGIELLDGSQPSWLVLVQKTVGPHDKFVAAVEALNRAIQITAGARIKFIVQDVREAELQTTAVVKANKVKAALDAFWGRIPIIAGFHYLPLLPGGQVVNPIGRLLAAVFIPNTVRVANRPNQQGVVDYIVKQLGALNIDYGAVVDPDSPLASPEDFIAKALSEGGAYVVCLETID